MNLPTEILSSVPFQYASDVKEGRITTGRKIKLAVDRFYFWLENADQKGFVLDNNSGMRHINFFTEFLVHTKGAYAGNAFELSPYQQFTIYNIFAWKKYNSNGQLVRVIKTVYEKVGRKNGKTAVLAGLGLDCQGFDFEEAPEIYVGATKEAQAKVLWEQAYQFVFKSLKLRKIGFKNTQREIRSTFNIGVFRFLGGDSKTLDGLNPSVSIIDEYHAHKDDSIREVLESAMGARLQPLIYIITTAGTNVVSACKLYEDVCVEILEGQKEDDSTFIMIHDLDDDDDWQDETNWIKANPNLGVSISMDYLRSEFQKAINQPSKAPNFKTKHLNMWVDSPEIWIPTEIWKKNKVDSIPMEKFQTFGSFAALDLSTTTDLTAYINLSEPDENGDRYILPYFFCPKDTIDKRSKEDHAPYRDWMDRELLIATPGNTVDYDAVQEKVLETFHVNGVKRLEMDQWNAAQMANNLTKAGIEVSFFSQAISNMSFPTKQFEKLVYEGKIKHDGNPILEWMLSGCVVIEDPNENIKVHKGKSHMGKKRVDGIVATIMALGGSLSIEQTNESKYNNPNEEIIM
jgi:phage terminase large subunit-like protein